ncbi:MAG: hypothetical protein WCJ93_10980 [Methanomicrobiales archaeon]
MKCPVCGGDCVDTAHDILLNTGQVFSPCPDCQGRVLDKKAPLKNRFYEPPCSCGKRFIDEVFAHSYVVMIEEGLLSGTEPLAKVGMPLIHPGFVMREPPYLPPRSLVLVSAMVTPGVAARLVSEVPEIRGVVRSGDFVPGIAGPEPGGVPRTYELLAGCDVRASIFPTSSGPLVLYQQQSQIHIEFPRNYNPKIESVERKITLNTQWFVDAACGVGTLGLTAARLGVPHVVMNDAWFSAAFWSAFNISINSEFLAVDEVVMHRTYEEIKARPVGNMPEKIAETRGRQSIEVYQGDLAELYRVLPGVPVLTALDLFNKEDKGLIQRITALYREHVSGEVFIP